MALSNSSSPTPSSPIPTVTLSIRAVMPLESFHRFTEMPQEIQDKVWLYASKYPRIVEISATGRNGKEPLLGSKTRAPAMLHVCYSSRMTGKLLYQKLYLQGKFTGTWVNWKDDYISYLSARFDNTSDHIRRSTQRPQEKDKVDNFSDIAELCENLACPKDQLSPYYFRYYWYLLDVYSLMKFRNLKRIGIYGMPAFSGKGDLIVPAYDHETPRFVASNWFYTPEALRVYSIEKRLVPELIDIGDLVRSGRPEKPLSLQVPPAMPQVPVKSSVRSSFIGLSIIALKQAAKQRGLKPHGSRNRVLGRLKEDEIRKALKPYEIEMRAHSEAMERYNEDLAEYNKKLEAYNTALYLWQTTQKSDSVQSKEII